MTETKKRILITGGAGFIGFHLSERLLGQGKEVFIMDDLSTGLQQNIDDLAKKGNGSLHFIKGSVLDKRLVSEAVSGADEVYHLAAAVGVKTIIDNPLSSFLINVDGTKNVLEAAAERKIPVIVTSSSEVYGKNDDIPFKEEADRVYGSAYHARWGYGLSKGSDEFLGLAYFREKGLPVIIVRLFNVIGPRQRSHYGMVVPRFIKQALAGAGQKIEVYGDGSQTRCFAYVGDVISALTGLMESKEKAYGQIFNVGSDEEISIKELAAKILKLVPESASEISYVPYAKIYGENFDDMRRRKPDLGKIKEVIGYNQLSLEESLKKVIDYFKK